MPLEGGKVLGHPEWEAAMWQACSPMKVWPDDRRAFRATIELWDLGGLGLTRFGAPGYRAEQTPGEIHRARRDALLLTIPVDGRCGFSQFGRSVTLGPGDAAFHRTTSPVEYTQKTDATMMLVRVPADRIAAHVPCIEDVCGVRIPADDLILKAVVAGVAAVPEVHAAGTIATRNAFAEGLVAGLAAIAAQIAGAREPNESVTGRRRVSAVKAFIDRHLAEPDLTPDRIASANGISVRYLHHLFQADGRSVTSFVLERRLEQCRRGLESGALAALGVNEIGMRAGFGSDAHFRRAFKSRFGLSPREYRKRGSMDAMPA